MFLFSAWVTGMEGYHKPLPISLSPLAKVIVCRDLIVPGNLSHIPSSLRNPDKKETYWSLARSLRWRYD